MKTPSPSTAMMTKFIASLELDHETKKALNERFYSFLEGKDGLGDLDLDEIHTAAAIGEKVVIHSFFTTLYCLC